MKIFFYSLQHNSQDLLHRKIAARFTFVLVAALFSAGCSKQAASTTVSAQPSETTPTTVSAQPADMTASPERAVKPNVVPVAIASDGPDLSPMLAQLTQVLRRFSVERRQVPKSLNELVVGGYLVSLPAAPAGKQFVIEQKRLEVVLQNH